MSELSQATIRPELVTELVTRLQQADQFPELRKIYVDFLSGVGVRMMSYHHLPPLGAEDYDPHIAVMAHGFPDSWVQRYVDESLYDIDPIPQHAAKSALPFKWSEARHFQDLTDDNRRYLDLLDAAALGDGLAIPVFGPHGRNGYAGYGFGTPTLEIGNTEIALLRWAAQIGHLAYCDLLMAHPKDACHLSPRECEVMAWAARGKSNAVIAEILGVSRHTVDTHVRRVFNKLGVADRVTATLRALSLGLI
ncbi:MAG: LuxR family transcriptional regulator [Pseudomonadota bacterium]